MIEYRFIFEKSPPMRFQVQLDRTRHDSSASGPHADWTRLCVHQCSLCPLKTATQTHCPAAVDLESIVEQFRQVVSFEQVRVEVETPQRTYVKSCDVQTGLRSMIGLVLATSQCPWFNRLRSLADSHLPFASIEETLIRVTGNYLLQQYQIACEGGTPDLAMLGLEEYYQSLCDINLTFRRRLEMASTSDANLNAIGAFSTLAQGISLSLRDKLQAIRSTMAPVAIEVPLSTPASPDFSHRERIDIGCDADGKSP